MHVPVKDEIRQIYRNPGGKLRGIVYISADGQSPVTVESFPAVTIEFDEDDRVFVAECECFDLVGTAYTEEQAVRELEITLRVYLSQLLEHGYLYDTLEQTGWKRLPNRKRTKDDLVRELEAEADTDAMYTPRIVLSASGEGAPVA